MAQINVSFSPYRMEAASGAKKVDNKQQTLTGAKTLEIDINPVFAMVTLMLLAVLLSGLYLVNFNKIATKGYELKKLEVARQKLQNESDVTNMYLAKVQSLNNIMSTDRVSIMRKPAAVQYVVGDTVIAQR